MLGGFIYIPGLIDERENFSDEYSRLAEVVSKTNKPVYIELITDSAVIYGFYSIAKLSDGTVVIMGSDRLIQVTSSGFIVSTT